MSVQKKRCKALIRNIILGSPPITGEAIEKEPNEVDKEEVFELEGEQEDTHHHHR